VVANGYLTEGSMQTQIIEDLYGLLDTIVAAERDNKEMIISVDLETLENYPDFKIYIMEENARVIECRIFSLDNFIAFMKPPPKELANKSLTKDKCLQLWGIPIKSPATKKDTRQAPPKVLDEKDEDDKDGFTVIGRGHIIGRTKEASHAEARGEQ
jgi:hypothetical protein